MSATVVPAAPGWCMHLDNGAEAIIVAWVTNVEEFPSGMNDTESGCLAIVQDTNETWGPTYFRLWCSGKGQKYVPFRKGPE